MRSFRGVGYCYVILSRYNLRIERTRHADSLPGFDTELGDLKNMME